MGLALERHSVSVCLYLPDDISYGLYDDFWLLDSHHVPALGLDQLAILRSAGQIHLKLMPIDREPVHFGARGTGETLVLQDNQRDVEMPLQMLAEFRSRS